MSDAHRLGERVSLSDDEASVAVVELVEDEGPGEVEGRRHVAHRDPTSDDKGMVGLDYHDVQCDLGVQPEGVADR